MRKLFLEKCFSDFYTTSTIYWEFSSEQKKKAEYTVADVPSLVKQIFFRIKDRLLNKTLLTAVDCFVFSILHKQYGYQEIYNEVTTLRDDQLEEIFQIAEKRKAVQGEENLLEEELNQWEKNERLIFGGIMVPI